MATDRRLDRDFWLSEFPGWRSASEIEVSRAEQLVRTILQPARRAWGTIRITSWLRSSGAHRTGAAVDFVPTGAYHAEPGDPPHDGTGEDINGVKRVHGWLATFHPDAYGELLYELPSPGETTPHIHVTLPGVGGSGEVLTQSGWDAGDPTWELGYLVPAALPLLAIVGLLLLVLLLYAGRGGG